MKITLPFVIVVEGKTDTDHLHQLFNVKTIETNGYALDHHALNLIQDCLDHHINVVFMLDPDAMGNKLRDKLNHLFPNIKNVFLQYQDMDPSKKKIGVAESRPAILINLLTNLKFDDNEQQINNEALLTWPDFLASNILFDASLKQKVLAYYHLPQVNNKKLFNYLLMLKVTKEQWMQLITKLNQIINPI